MSCFCCPCRFESRKNPHFGTQKGAKYELYINIDGIFRVAHRFGFFVKMPAPGTFLCFASVIFPRRFVVMPCSPCLSTVIPASSVKCIAFSRLAPGSPPRRACRFLLRCRAGPPPLWRSLSPTPGVPVCCSIVGRVPFPLGRSLSPAPGVPGFCSVVGQVSSSPLWRFQPCAADGSPSGNKRSRVLPGSGKYTESGGSSQMSFRRF